MQKVSKTKNKIILNFKTINSQKKQTMKTNKLWLKVNNPNRKIKSKMVKRKQIFKFKLNPNLKQLSIQKAHLQLKQKIIFLFQKLSKIPLKLTNQLKSIHLNMKLTTKFPLIYNQLHPLLTKLEKELKCLQPLKLMPMQLQRQLKFIIVIKQLTTRMLSKQMIKSNLQT